MITKKEIKDAGFSSIEEYLMNVKSMNIDERSRIISRMSKRQKNLYGNLDPKRELETLKERYLDFKNKYLNLKKSINEAAKEN